MLRTSLYLPTKLHQRLIVASKQEGKPMSRLVAEMLERVLSAQEQDKLRHLYSGLHMQGGFGAQGVSDASTTVNDILYGDTGAWKGGRE